MVVPLATVKLIVVEPIVRNKAIRNEVPYKHFFPSMDNANTTDVAGEVPKVATQNTLYPSVFVDDALPPIP